MASAFGTSCLFFRGDWMNREVGCKPARSDHVVGENM